MSMNSSAQAYEQASSYEQRRIRVLDGGIAKAREDAKRADVVKIAMAVSVVLIYLLSMTFMSAKTCGLGVELNSLKSQIAETQAQTARAELELGELSSLERIEAYAVDNLNMVYPAAGDIYFLDVESSQILAQADEAAAAAEATAVTEQPSVWQNFIGGLSNFFTGKASAAEN